MFPSLLRYIPNLLTCARLILIIPFLLALYRGSFLQAFNLYLIAGLTDALDGWFARYFHWKTPLGSFLDPLADKLLISASFISLAFLNELPWWLVALVFMRDLTISLGVLAWYFLIKMPLTFKPLLLSKINTSLQLLLVTLCLFQLAFYPLKTMYVQQILIILTAITTTATYCNYVWVWGKKAYFAHQFCK